MKTILIHSSFGLWPMLEYELDIAQKELDLGNKVVFLYCDGGQAECPANGPKANSVFKKRYCYECKSRVHKGVSWLKEGLGRLHVEAYSLDLDDVVEVRNKLRDVELAYPNEKLIKLVTDIDGTDNYDGSISSVMSKLKNSSLSLKKNWILLSQYIVHFHHHRISCLKMIRIYKIKMNQAFQKNHHK